MSERIPVVVIGASAGGVEALTRLVRDIPADFAGALFVAMHFPMHATSVLPGILQRSGPLRARHAENDMAIERGCIYVAPPDRHLLLLRRRMRLARGPRENGNRPAIDPMFRSAAISHGPRAVGVVLTGNLDDGTAGLLAIKRRGGIAVVQDPDDAAFPSMPMHAAAAVDVDHVLPLAEIAPKLAALVAAIAARPDLPAPATAAPLTAPLTAPHTAPDDAERELRYAALDMNIVEDVGAHPGTPSQFGCPDCGGVLWEIRDGELVRYRCRVGHAWTADGLRGAQAEQLDQALWTALRALEESASLSDAMAARARSRGNEVLAAGFERDARIAVERARVVRETLLAPPPDGLDEGVRGDKAAG